MGLRSIPCSGGGLALGIHSEILFCCQSNITSAIRHRFPPSPVLLGPYTCRVMSEQVKEVVVIGAGILGFTLDRGLMVNALNV